MSRNFRDAGFSQLEPFSDRNIGVAFAKAAKGSEGVAIVRILTPSPFRPIPAEMIFPAFVTLPDPPPSPPYSRSLTFEVWGLATVGTAAMCDCVEALRARVRSFEQRDCMSSREGGEVSIFRRYSCSSSSDNCEYAMSCALSVRIDGNRHLICWDVPK